METTSEFTNNRSKVTYLDTALNDVVVARCLVENQVYVSVPSICSQAIEKMLKHLIVQEQDSDLSILKTHNLKSIYRCLYRKSKSIEIIKSCINEVDGYYFTNRYPSNDFVYGDENSATEALECTERVLIYVMEHSEEFKHHI